MFSLIISCIRLGWLIICNLLGSVVVFKNEKACKKLLKTLLPNNELEFIIDNDIHLDNFASMPSYVQST